MRSYQTHEASMFRQNNDRLNQVLHRLETLRRTAYRAPSHLELPGPIGVQPIRYGNPASTLPSTAQTQQGRAGSPGPGGRTHPTVLQQLSTECQIRRFNPVWLIRKLENGRVACDVRLHNHVIEANSDFDCTQSAKTAIAKKALDVVRSWPVGCLPPLPVKQSSEPPEPVNAPQLRSMNTLPPRTVGTGGSQRRRVPWLGRSAAMTSEQNRGRRGNSRTAARPDKGGKEIELLEHVRRVMGISVPNTTGDNPEATRAFLEGLAVGARLAGAHVSGFSMRSRSRSPLRSSPEAYRARSPLVRSGRLSPPLRHRRRASDSWPPRDRIEPRTPRQPVGRGDRWAHDRYHPGGSGYN
ncbi:hypothetical protein VTH82DRAFT_3919 [Thermothelomyces myriococcoides]